MMETFPYYDLVLALAILATAFIVAWASRFLTDQIISRLVGKTETRLDDVVIDTVRGPLRSLILIAGLQIALNQIRAIPDDWRTNQDDAFFVLYLLLLYMLAFKLVNGITHWYSREIAHKTETDTDDQFLSLIRHTALLVVSIIAVIVVLEHFGIEISAMVTTLGIGSLAIALAAQATLGDMISGFVIIIDRPFKVGDRVEILDIDTWGDIVEIGLRSTRILTRDNRTVSIPNSIMGKGLIVNYSVPDTLYRVQTHVGIAYDTDVDFARQVMIDAIRAEDWVMKDKRIEALLLELGDYALIFRVRCWIKHYVETRRIIDKMNTALHKALNRENIIMPIPQRELHLVSSVTPETGPATTLSEAQPHSSS